MWSDIKSVELGKLDSTSVNMAIIFGRFNFGKALCKDFESNESLKLIYCQFLVDPFRAPKRKRS